MTIFCKQFRKKIAQGEQPTPGQIADLLHRLLVAEFMLKTLLLAVHDTEQERDAYAILAHHRAQMIETLQQSFDTIQSLPVETFNEKQNHFPHQTRDWQYNLREFFELNSYGWRAIVTSDSEEAQWIAYIEQSGMRLYATQKYTHIQDALKWCSDEIEHQVLIASY